MSNSGVRRTHELGDGGFIPPALGPGFIPPVSLVHERTAKTVATLVRAESAWARGWGVIPWPELPQGRGLWLPGVASVHTCFVRFSLDLLFLDGELRTVRTEENVPPWRLLVRAAGARHTVELGAGTLAGRDVRPGDRWRINEEKTTDTWQKT